MLRAQYPQRAMLLNRLRYLLEGRTTQKGFAIWEGTDGTRWCGFAAWQGQAGRMTPKRQWLLADSASALADALPNFDPLAFARSRISIGPSHSRCLRLLPGFFGGSESQSFSIVLHLKQPLGMK